MDKNKELIKIAGEIESCGICKIGKSGLAVPGEGDSKARIMFIGEAPGKTEAKTGRPFVGRSGKLLRQMISDVGLKENEVYITSPVKYLPDRGTPTVPDIEHGKTHLFKQIEVIDPKIIVLLGSVGSYAMLGEKIQVLKRHGEILEKDGRKFLITLHPSAVLRFPNKYKELFMNDLKRLKVL